MSGGSQCAQVGETRAVFPPLAEYTGSFEAAPPGTVMVIPENPEGEILGLVKHGSK